MTFYQIRIGNSSKNMLWGAPAPYRPKHSKNDLPGAPPGGGATTKNDPNRRQEGPKTAPRAVNAIFQLPLFRPERPPQADLAPKTPQEGPGSPFGTPRGAKFDPRGGRHLLFGAFLVGTAERRFSPFSRPFPTQVTSGHQFGKHFVFQNVHVCSLLCGHVGVDVRPPAKPFPSQVASGLQFGNHFGVSGVHGCTLFCGPVGPLLKLLFR